MGTDVLSFLVPSLRAEEECLLLHKPVPVLYRHWGAHMHTYTHTHKYTHPVAHMSGLYLTQALNIPEFIYLTYYPLLSQCKVPSLPPIVAIWGWGMELGAKGY